MKKNNFKKSGFTLIELLVVITIIGILATIVVVNLNSARGRGQDTAIKEQMSQLRATAALYYDDNYGYSAAVANSAITGTCPTTAGTANVFDQTDFIRSLQALIRNSGNTPNCYLSAGTAAAQSQAWALTVRLRIPQTSGGMWCVDSLGNSKEVTSAPTDTGSGYVCP